MKARTPPPVPVDPDPSTPAAPRSAWWSGVGLGRRVDVAGRGRHGGVGVPGGVPTAAKTGGVGCHLSHAQNFCKSRYSRPGEDAPGWESDSYPWRWSMTISRIEGQQSRVALQSMEPLGGGAG
ncbi:MAG: hypothetical protein H7836_09410 [Magnetococcus sp. YQC-3]